LYTLNFKIGSDGKLNFETSILTQALTSIPMILNKLPSNCISNAVDIIGPASSSCLLLGGDYDSSITLLSVDSLTTRRMKLHDDVVTCIRVSEDQKYVLTCSADSTTCLWDASVLASTLNFAAGFKRTMVR
jgi:WD40 repeat protein